VKKIVVTGSEGFIGSKVVSKLRSIGCEVFTIDLLPGKENHFSLDITSDKLSVTLEQISPDCIVHLAAQIDVTQSILDPAKDLEINGFGTLNLVSQAARIGCSNFIYVHSGGAIYDSKNVIPIVEESHELPISPYGLSKQIGEGYVRIFCNKNHIQWSSLALSNCYGNISENPKGVIFEFVNRISQNLPAVINGPKVTRDFIHVDDVTEAIILAASTPTNQRVNISSGKEVSLIDLHERILKILGKNIAPIIKDIRDGDVTKSALSNSKAFELLGWKPQIEFQDGLVASIQGGVNFDK
jgi:UDP-glucose 4-epimerase